MTGTQRNARKPPKWSAPDLSDRLLRIEDVMKMTSLSQSAIYEMMSEKRFPVSRVVARRAVRWMESEVTAWMRKLPVSDRR